MVGSPRKLFITMIKNNIYRIRVSQEYFIAFWKQNHWLQAAMRVTANWILQHMPFRRSLQLHNVSRSAMQFGIGVPSICADWIRKLGFLTETTVYWNSVRQNSGLQPACTLHRLLLHWTDPCIAGLSARGFLHACCCSHWIQWNQRSLEVSSDFQVHTEQYIIQTQKRVSMLEIENAFALLTFFFKCL